MLIYEIHLAIKETRRDEFLDWVKSHIAEVLSSNNFSKAIFFEEKSFENLEALSHQFVIHYVVNSFKDLQNYLEKFAPSLRQESADKFGDDLKIQRKLLESMNVKSFS